MRSNPVWGAKYLPLRVHPHFRLTARGHVAAEMANIGGIGLSRRERRWRQKGRNRLPAVRRRPVSQSLRVGLPFWLTANSINARPSDLAGDPLPKTRHRGLLKVGWMFTFTAAAYNLVRMRTLHHPAL